MNPAAVESDWGRSDRSGIKHPPYIPSFAQGRRVLAMQNNKGTCLYPLSRLPAQNSGGTRVE